MPMLSPDKYFTIMPRALDMTRRTELYYTNEFTFAVAVILSAQATDKKVNEVTPRLFAAADTPGKMLAMGTDGIKKYINVISFFNNKAKNIVGLARELIGKSLPHDRNELMKLPGIGQKTANVVSNVLWGAPNIGVDTHVFRLAHRFGWVTDADNTPEKVEQKLLKIIPKKYYGIVNHVMVMHGRYICKALRPDCTHCPVAKYCPSKQV